MAQEWITVQCDDGVGTVSRVTREAFDTLYSKIGWKEVDESVVEEREALATAVVQQPVDPNRMSKDQLVAMAAAKGIQLDGSETKSDIANLLQGS